MILPPQDIVLVEALLRSMKSGRGSHSHVIEVLCRDKNIAVTIEEAHRAEGLLFSLGLVCGDLSCYFLTEDGLFAQRLGVAALMEEKRRHTFRKRISYALSWVTVVCAVLTLVLSLLK